MSRRRIVIALRFLLVRAVLALVAFLALRGGGRCDGQRVPADCYVVR